MKFIQVVADLYVYFFEKGLKYIKEEWNIFFYMFK